MEAIERLVERLRHRTEFVLGHDGRPPGQITASQTTRQFYDAARTGLQSTADAEK